MAKESTKTFRNSNGDRLGFASKRTDDNGRTRYNIGVDNMGSAYRGVMDRELNTPLGSIGYGYDGDTDYLSYQAPYVQNYPGGMSALMSGGERMGFINKDVNNGTPTYTIGSDLGDPNRTVYDGGFNTPIGRVGYGYDGNTSYGQFTPNDYIMALARLLGR